MRASASIPASAAPHRRQLQPADRAVHAERPNDAVPGHPLHEELTNQTSVDAQEPQEVHPRPDRRDVEGRRCQGQGSRLGEPIAVNGVAQLEWLPTSYQPAAIVDTRIP